MVHWPRLQLVLFSRESWCFPRRSRVKLSLAKESSFLNSLWTEAKVELKAGMAAYKQELATWLAVTPEDNVPLRSTEKMRGTVWRHSFYKQRLMSRCQSRFLIVINMESKRAEIDSRVENANAWKYWYHINQCHSINLFGKTSLSPFLEWMSRITIQFLAHVN